uniref:SCP domain-containing protein n=1 Tax=Strongyloides papillosus TaxID=174720 RepID=A0A0N5BV81_STREA
MNFVLYSLFYIVPVIFQIDANSIIIEVAHKIISNKYFFYYDYTTFVGKEDLSDYIVENNPELAGKEIIIKIVGIINKYNKISISYPSNFYRTCLPSINKSGLNKEFSLVRHVKDDTIITFSFKGDAKFECYGRRVPSLREFAECVLRKRRVTFDPACLTLGDKNEHAICNKKYSMNRIIENEVVCEKPDTLLLILEGKLGRNSFSSLIWKKIWNNRFSFGCYSYMNFKLLKERFLREINAYRTAHKAYPLIESLQISEEAQKRAEEIASQKKIMSIEIGNYDEIIGFSDLIYAPLMVKKWYDEVLFYNFKFPFFTNKVSNFVKMVWKSTTHVGIGIAKCKCKIFVVLKFSPKIKNTHNFISNIKSRRANSLF